MRAKIVVILLLWATVAWGAQATITIPEGTTVYGPITVSEGHRWSDIILARSPKFTDSRIQGTITVQFSTDGAATFLEHPVCILYIQGGVIPNNTTSLNECAFPEGVTHLKATAVVTGGSIVLTGVPTVQSRMKGKGNP